MWYFKSNDSSIRTLGAVDFRHLLIHANRVWNEYVRLKSPAFSFISTYGSRWESNGVFRRGVTSLEGAIVDTESIYWYPSAIFYGTSVSDGFKASRAILDPKSDSTVLYCSFHHASSTWIANTTTLTSPIWGLEIYLGSRSKHHRSLICFGVLAMHMTSTGLLGSAFFSRWPVFLPHWTPPCHLRSQKIVGKRGHMDTLYSLVWRICRSVASLLYWFGPEWSLQTSVLHTDGTVALSEGHLYPALLLMIGV